MASKLQDEIKQRAPFGSVREELLLNLLRTAAAVTHVQEQMLRPHGLSQTQYNVLRILRGAGAPGLCQYEVGQRLVAMVPDVPRILSRMERAGWVMRARGVEDRRVVKVMLTADGRALVDRLDETTRAMGQTLFPAMSEREVEQACELLAKAREQARA